MCNSYKLFILTLLLSVSACGFHLRGTQVNNQTKAYNLYVIDAGASSVGREVRTQLELSGTSLALASEGAEYTLQLFDQSVEQSVLSVSADTGKIEEYQIQLSVMMTLTDRDNTELLSNQPIQITRDYGFDEQAVLGSESERQLLLDEMTKQTATQIIRRLNTLTGR